MAKGRESKTTLEKELRDSESFNRDSDPHLSDSSCRVRLFDSVARRAILDSKIRCAGRGMSISILRMDWNGVVRRSGTERLPRCTRASKSGDTRESHLVGSLHRRMGCRGSMCMVRLAEEPPSVTS